LSLLIAFNNHDCVPFCVAVENKEETISNREIPVYRDSTSETAESAESEASSSGVLSAKFSSIDDRPDDDFLRLAIGGSCGNRTMSVS